MKLSMTIFIWAFKYCSFNTSTYFTFMDKSS